MSLWHKIKTTCAGLSPDCCEAVRAQSEALDHPLPPLRRLGLRLHLLLCTWCRRYGRQIHFLHEAAHKHPDDLTQASPSTLPADARERIKQRLRQGK